MDIVQIAYGKGRLPLRLDPDIADWHIVSPRPERPLANARAAFLEACRRPIAAPPLRDVVQGAKRIVIVTCDGTRALPNHLLMPWLLEAMDLPLDRVTVLLGNGTHRANTDIEIAAMFGPELARRLRILNHDAFAPESCMDLGTTPSGIPVRLDREYVDADARIALGFIEPHFFAGYSGGPKAVAPGIAAIDTIFHLHSHARIAHPNSDWDVLDGNPLHEAISEAAGLMPPDFLVNVALNTDRTIANVFAGHWLEAHRAGCAHVRKQAIIPVKHYFPIVVTSNSGYPLDQNLYQSVKGLSAAARIAEPGGVILVASECSDGIPDHGQFGRILREHDSAAAVDAYLRNLAEPVLDQWQAQVLARILLRHEVRLFSALDLETVRAAKMIPVADFEEEVRGLARRLGSRPPIAVLPDGPLSVPCVQ